MSPPAPQDGAIPADLIELNSVCKQMVRHVSVNLRQVQQQMPREHLQDHLAVLLRLALDAEGAEPPLALTAELTATRNTPVEYWRVHAPNAHQLALRIPAAAVRALEDCCVMEGIELDDGELDPAAAAADGTVLRRVFRQRHPAPPIDAESKLLAELERELHLAVYSRQRLRMEGQTEPAPSKGKEDDVGLEYRAIAAFVERPTTMSELARRLGCHPKSLSRFELLRKVRGAWSALNQSERPRGWKDANGNLEAFDR
jgi:hypothetical protein